MSKQKKYDDDDGRTIADMSGVERRNVFLPRIPGLREKPESDADVPEVPREERKWYILGALKAALVIAGAFILGLGICILIMCLIW